MKGNLLSCGILMLLLTIMLSGFAYQPTGGRIHEAVPDSSAFRQTIERLGLQEPSADWSNKADIRLPEPRCA